MDEVIIFFKIIAIIYMMFWLIKIFSNLMRGKCDSILFVMLVFFFFFGVPLFLDVIIGVPNYRFYGFNISKDDFNTNIIYLVYFIIAPIIFWIFGRCKYLKELDVKIIKEYLKTIRVPKSFFFIILITIFLPIIAVLFSPYPLAYLNYGFVVSKSKIPFYLTSNIFEFHGLVAKLTHISNISCAVFFIIKKNVTYFTMLFCILVGIFNCYLHGKRSVAAIFLLLMSIILFIKGFINKRNILIYVFISLILIITFSNIYQTNVRSKNYQNDFKNAYRGYRVDYGRDDELKMTIYSLLNPDQIEILEYRGQSLLFNILFFVPRKFWPNKPWPYAVYFTNAMLGIKNVTPLGWGMTTSWLGECISNFGWLGLIFGPLSVALCCKFSDKKNHIILRLLTILSFSMLLVLEFSAISIFVLLWFLCLLYV